MVFWLLSHLHFISLEEQMASVQCNKGVVYSIHVGTKHSVSSPAYHPPTRLPSLPASQKAGRSVTLWKSYSGSAHSFTWKLKTQKKQRNLSQEQLLEPSDSKDAALALFLRTLIRFNMFQSHLSPKTSSWARLWGVTEGISYLLDVCDIPHPQLTVSTPCDQTLLFRYQSHPPNLSRCTTRGIRLWLL